MLSLGMASRALGWRKASVTAGSQFVKERPIVHDKESEERLVVALGTQLAPSEFESLALKYSAVMRKRLEAARNAKQLQRRGSRLAMPIKAKTLLRRPSRVANAIAEPDNTAEEEPSRRRLSRRESIALMAGGASLLQQRLRYAGLEQVEMVGDGNCQFRALSHQLYNSQEEHAYVRHTVCKRMRECSDFFSIYFESLGEFETFMRRMSTERTWGDELTLRAAADAFHVTIHVITTERQNWHLRYEPEGDKPPNKTIFLTYISPVHYNAISRDITTARESYAA